MTGRVKKRARKHNMNKASVKRTKINVTTEQNVSVSHVFFTDHEELIAGCSKTPNVSRNIPKCTCGKYDFVSLLRYIFRANPFNDKSTLIDEADCGGICTMDR